MNYLVDIAKNFMLLFIESAPFLLIGMLLAGIIRQMVPDKWINKTLGKNSSVLTAAVIGTPLPLCSCSVIPAAMGIRRAGASKASTASFMVATPETGVDSISITYALMGPIMAIARPIAAISSAVIAGVLVRWWDVETPAAPVQVKSCCAHKQASETQESFVSKFKRAVMYGYGQLLADFMLWLLIGLFFAALIQTFVPPSFLAQYGQGPLAMLVMVVISIPMYICATASTPIAAGLMLAGVSPGAALVFMLAGPASNIATLMVIKNELGSRSLVGYLVGVIVTAMLSGLILDWLIGQFNWQIVVQHGSHNEMISWVYQLSALVLAGLIGWQISKKLFNRSAKHAHS